MDTQAPGTQVDSKSKGNPSESVRRHGTTIIAVFSLSAILVHVVMRFLIESEPHLSRIPLLATLIFGGIPLLYGLLKKVFHREFGSDLLGGIAIVTAILLGEYLAGSIIVLMLSGGEALESFALRRASSVLAALARRMPQIAHRKSGPTVEDIQLSDVQIDDILVVHPHEVCPVDGVVIEGHGVMDESYLTGEPYQITKTSGSSVISGAINGDSLLTIRASRKPEDSRYAKIMEVMRESEASRPRLRRLGDKLGALYTPVALGIALLAWTISGEAVRFLAVLVIATPCPLLIAIPITIIGSISLCARRAIIVKSAAALEQATNCRTAIFDKTGTLTHGAPAMTDIVPLNDMSSETILTLVGSLERYSKHPLARAVIDATEVAGIALPVARDVREPPGQGLQGLVAGRKIEITSRNKVLSRKIQGADTLPSVIAGLECVVLVDNQLAAVLRFRDTPREESVPFIKHLGPKHQFERVLIVSGDRGSEVRHLAKLVGIDIVHSEKSPEEKLEIVRSETTEAKTLYVGDGINDAPAMMAATVGMAIGQNSDVTAEAADVVILDSTLGKVDEFLHISRRMRTIALQSAVGGMALSLIGMGFAAAGMLSPVHGAIAQEIIDVLAVLNALRAAFPPRVMQDLNDD